MQFPTLTLTRALFALVVTGLVLLAGAAALLLHGRLSTADDARMEREVGLRTQSAATALGRALEEDWQDLVAIAETLDELDREELAAVLGATAGTERKISWAGYAATSGEVVAASGGLLVGADVSMRPWFQRGLRGDFAGDLHEAVLLANLMEAEPEEPIRFLDLARPIVGTDGSASGVLGFHINARWLEQYLTSFARALEAEFYLVSQSGEVLIATDKAMMPSMSQPSLRTAAAGAQSAGYEIWPDGNRYFAAVLPDVTYGALPSFGWRLIGRIDPAAMPGSTRQEMLRLLGAVLTGAAVLFLVIAATYSRLFLHPLGRLADNAERISASADEYPIEITRTSELARLSTALARLQGRS